MASQDRGNNSQDLCFHFALTVADYRSALYFSALGRSRGRMLFYVFAWLLSLTALGLEYFGLGAPMEKLIRMGLLFTAIMGPCLMLMHEFAVFRFKKVLQKTQEASRGLCFTEDGVEFLREHRRHGNFEPWEQFCAAYESKKLLVLYLEARHMVYIPKSCATQEQWQRAYSLLRCKLGKRWHQTVA